MSAKLTEERKGGRRKEGVGMVRGGRRNGHTLRHGDVPLRTSALKAFDMYYFITQRQ